MMADWSRFRPLRRDIASGSCTRSVPLTLPMALLSAIAVIGLGALLGATRPVAAAEAPAAATPLASTPTSSSDASVSGFGTSVSGMSVAASAPTPSPLPLAAGAAAPQTAAACCLPVAEGKVFTAEGPLTFTSKLFDTSDYPARWYCGNWSSDVGWLHIVSDIILFVGFYAIPAVLLYFLYKRRDDIAFPHALWLFAGLFVLCGLTHLMEAIIFWWPAYRLAGLLKMVTAALSCVTVVALARLLPKALSLPGVSKLSTELHARTVKYNALFESNVFGVIVCGLDGSIREANDTFLATVGYTREDLQDGLVNWAGMTPPEHQPSDTAAVESLLKTGRVDPWEKEYLCKDGSRVPVVVGGAMLQPKQHLDADETGPTDDRECICFVLDITERRDAERLLEDAVAEATRANQAKSEFLANMSHEIRTPLNGILGFADVLRRGGLTEEQREEYTGTIHTSGTHLLNLINDILDLSKVEAGQYEMTVEPVSPVQTILETMSVLRVRAEEKCIALECRWASGLPETIQTDAARLRQLLINLVGNAIKFTDYGSVTIITEFDDEAEMLVIDVQDTGIGISQDAQKMIFAPFAQADGSITRKYGGTGLGLSICRMIAEGLGGTISVTSRPRVGSTFRVAVPVGCLDGVEIRDPSMSEIVRTREEVEEIDQSQLVGHEVLVCEDGRTNRHLIELILTNAGAEVTLAENGLEGVEAIRAQPDRFDLVLMDMQMPVMDGYTATRTLREEGYDRPIVALTAHAMRGDEEKVREAGCSGYLTKPVDIDQLLRTIGGTARTDHPQEVHAARAPETAAAAPDDDGVDWILPKRPVMAGLQAIVDDFVSALRLDMARLPGWVEAAGEDDADACQQIAEFAHSNRGAADSLGYGCLTEPLKALEDAAEARRAAIADGTASASEHGEEQHTQGNLSDAIDAVGEIVARIPSRGKARQLAAEAGDAAAASSDPAGLAMPLRSAALVNTDRFAPSAND